MSYYGSYAAEHRDQQEYERLKLARKKEAERSAQATRSSQSPDFFHLDDGAYHAAHDAWNEARLAPFKDESAGK